MRQTDKLPELLAPAGSFEHLKAAIKAGADAVYMGGQQFGARAYADNFSKEDLVEALQYAHFYGKKLYLTVNTLLKEEEMKEKLYDFLSPFYDNGLDGVIVQDLGAATFFLDAFPGMEIHGSTQMTITDVYGAKAAARLGMNRVVPARELSLEEIKKIKKETGLEVEVFVHGALCYCYSGQCLFSSMYGGRSGNRGRCAQPCRLPYRAYRSDGSCLVEKEKSNGNSWKTEGHLLSPKDLCALSVLPALIEAEVDSLKIEGRMKNIEYVAGVTAIYRKYLDHYQMLRANRKQADWKVEQKDQKNLQELYSRMGFTEGYWDRHNGKEMMATVYPRNLGRKIGRLQSVGRGEIEVKLQKGEQIHPKDLLVLPLETQEEIVLTVPNQMKRKENTIFLKVSKGKELHRGMPVFRRKNEVLSEWIQNTILEKEIKYPVTAEVNIKIDEPVEVILKCKENVVCLRGKKAEISEKRPITKEDVFRQMNKTGEVPFYLDQLEIQLDPQVFYPMSSLKQLRQNAFQKLKTIMETKKMDLHSKQKSDTVISLNNREKDWIPCKKIAFVYSKEGWKICLSQPFFDGICIPYAFWKEENILATAEKICSSGKKAFLSLPEIMRNGYTKIREICSSELWSGIYVHTIGEAEFLYECQERKAPILASPSFYQWNHWSIEKTRDLFGIPSISLPLELSKQEAEVLCEMKSMEGIECMVYGRIPIMRSAQCLKKTTGCCDHQREILVLENSKGYRFPVVSHCEFCYNTIWTDTPRNLIGEDFEKIREKLDTFCFHFFDETEEILTIIQEFMQWEKKGFCFTKKKKPEEHWKYGVE